jgi:hypothetical protein
VGDCLRNHFSGLTDKFPHDNVTKIIIYNVGEAKIQALLRTTDKHAPDIVTHCKLAKCNQITESKIGLYN